MTDIQHHGVKGMRWGRRKAQGEQVVSSDAVKARAAATKAKQHGTQALSNDELRALTNRLNLEQSLGRLDTTKSRSAVGRKFVLSFLGNVAKTQGTRIANDVAAKQIENLLKKK